MGETDIPHHALSSASAVREASAPHTVIQSVAEPSQVAWDAPALPKPKMPGHLPSPPLPTPSITAKNAIDKEPARSWNTQNLGLRMGVDAMSAGAAGVLVAPIITMIDKGIIENASGRNTLGESLKNSAKELLLKPHRFLGSKPFALIFVRCFHSSYFQSILFLFCSPISAQTPHSSKRKPSS